ncbi:uncharacterized protein LOC129315121 [Prosopis cineraria]|uniref:uncharacterized protein LOC129315121 n=1 Tax=Prosopis cineraria TaxID=364024 RepID=UPI0024105FD9|nr:uncharacterized protein LOC129315121 [Prosopis cineraria]
MADNLFAGLPPPSANPFPPPPSEHEAPEPVPADIGESSPVSAPKPILKSALKRFKPTESDSEAAAPKKSLKFKTTTDASETQVIEAMKKISLHIKTPAKFSKASKLAIQLIQAGSVKSGTRDYFFSILEAAMSSSIPCTDPGVRADYHALFSAAQDATEHLNKKQKNQLTSWTISAVVANDLYTDDSFVFSKAAGRIKEAISNLPVATEEDDVDEEVSLKYSMGKVDESDKINQDKPLVSRAKDNEEEEVADPFGLDALIPGNKIEKKNGAEVKIKKDENEEDTKRSMKSRREALITCLEIAALRYKTPWCQTVIDILVKHAFDNVGRFTAQQRHAIEKLWASIREQQTRRKQGKSVNGKLDVNAFEWLQQKYAGEKISIRHSVGASGDRRAQQWLG